MALKGEKALKNFLAKHPIVCVDTSVFVYWIEDHPVYTPVLKPIFDRLDQKSIQVTTSTVSMLEILVKPYRDNDVDLVNQFYALLVSYPSLQWIDVSLPIADTAASIRAKYSLRTPDAIQAATAIHSGASGFIGNDSVFERVPELNTITLNKIL